LKVKFILFALLLVFALNSTAISQSINNGGAGFAANRWYQICSINQNGVHPSAWGTLETDLRVSIWTGNGYYRYTEGDGVPMTRGEGHWYYSLNSTNALDCGGYQQFYPPDFNVYMMGGYATMIGNPYHDAEDMRNFRIAGTSLGTRVGMNQVAQYLFTINANGNDYDLRSLFNACYLESGQAGWIVSYTNMGTVQGAFPGFGLNPEDGGGDPIRDEPESGWDLQIIVASSDGEYSHANNKLGIRENGTEEVDINDAPELDLPSSSRVQLFFPHPEWENGINNLTYDFRSLEFDGAKDWDFTVEVTNIENTGFYIDWAGLDEIPENYSLTLTDVDNDRVIGDMRNIGEVVFRSGDGDVQEFHFRVTCEYTPEWVGPGSSSLPEGFGLTNAYPNPFNNVVNLEYTLPMNQTASLKVYDMSGKLVDVVSSSLKGEGTVSWNANGMQSGVYMMHLESGDQVSLKKVILMQ